MFSVILEETREIVVTSHGEPALPDTNTPAFALVWSGNAHTSIRSDVSVKTFVGHGSEEPFQITSEGLAAGS